MTNQQVAPQNGQGLMEIDEADHVARALVPTTMKAAMDLAEYLAKSSLMPKALNGNPQNCFVVIMQGLELGLAPMAAIRGIYVVDGKPTLGSALMVAVVQRSGKAKYFNVIEMTAKRCVVETHRVGDAAPQRASFTIEEAQHLMHKDNWKNYPTDMLLARANARLVRAKYQDVTFGMSTTEEAIDLQETSPGSGVFSATGQVVQAPIPPMAAPGAPAVAVTVLPTIAADKNGNPIADAAATSAPPPGAIEAAIVGPTTSPAPTTDTTTDQQAMSVFEKLSVQIGEAADVSALNQLASRIKDAHEKAKTITDDERRQLREAYSARWEVVGTPAPSSGGAA